MNAGPWAAVSPCSAACLGGHPRKAPPLVTLRRCTAFGAHLAGAVAAGRRLGSGEEVRRRAGGLLADLGIGLDGGRGGLAVAGVPTGTLVVANHISWLDVLALLAVQPATLLAKREVGRWPLVGTLVRRAGTRFIDRDGLRGLPATVRELAALLRSGESVVVFPEGTTWCSAPGGPFRRATFQAALDAGAPVRPVTLAYTRNGAPTTLPAYVGEGTFAGSLRRVATARGLTVHVTAHPALHPAGHDRRTLAALARAAVFPQPPAEVHPQLGHRR
ncbi:1-acyl-sn-glycerol-3-phosphate acyltransferase [Streptomyces cocklensis]|uniref:1-acyl-sn-glycerol-3-phosphate acyltransferases n=1 Tax=Actinacidiphila cocklensis TaxID=887465 RepID=A0A9W4DX23_9ACTN|nr:lysophospholipid acyltransferase family protein [Actinacidiphila cocklensis]MDD1056789.1 1-acyl-sn-glycerol-3-phosphate acyltransferase [Actinacidiphila cocklensis]CAG6397730.1 1-acyl-sn-glycerol-3-phosphate acyltransferases [Actinacidiphila cocklensis]